MFKNMPSLIQFFPSFSAAGCSPFAVSILSDYIPKVYRNLEGL